MRYLCPRSIFDERTSLSLFPGVSKAVDDILRVSSCRGAEGLVGHETEGGERAGWVQQVE